MSEVNVCACVCRSIARNRHKRFADTHARGFERSKLGFARDRNRADVATLCVTQFSMTYHTGIATDMHFDLLMFAFALLLHMNEFII